VIVSGGVYSQLNAQGVDVKRPDTYGREAPPRSVFGPR
jgi:hypothetical protein